MDIDMDSHLKHIGELVRRLFSEPDRANMEVLLKQIEDATNAGGKTEMKLQSVRGKANMGRNPLHHPAQPDLQVVGQPKVARHNQPARKLRPKPTR